ncbi:DUF4238 domain-containing protein [Zunongwangia sp. F363]|uniref:DUF4238 domain-containing protein n=1 Tax=Autumnicola tepida TaxID=3075595 RepID=A0ABU3CF60_9FLAO|nr:DUF4238 domain-containing protein [Zunongwangia sp. F363]MDT0644990.1 DUF4238 domain-containing protein [Zunongwangia sp. F363]
MSKKKKRQHYVWRRYLRSWSNSKDLIPSLIKFEKKIATTNLMNVAQEKFYYSLQEFSKEEEIALKGIISNLSNQDTEVIFQEYYELFTSYSKLKRAIKNNEIPESKLVEIEDKLDLMKSNLMEDFHSDFESFGEKLMQIKTVEDLKFLDDDESELKTIIFLCFQYVRTKRMQNIFTQKFQGHYKILPKYFHILSFVLATGMANGFRNYKKTKFVFIENISSTDFITSDQPIINLKEDERDEKGNVISLEFFYPLNPTIALKVHYNDGNKYGHLKIKEKEVKMFNNIIFKKSEDFIFAKNSKQLEEYKNCL